MRNCEAIFRRGIRKDSSQNQGSATSAQQDASENIQKAALGEKRVQSPE